MQRDHFNFYINPVPYKNHEKDGRNEKYHKRRQEKPMQKI